MKYSKMRALLIFACTLFLLGCEKKPYAVLQEQIDEFIAAYNEAVVSKRWQTVAATLSPQQRRVWPGTLFAEQLMHFAATCGKITDGRLERLVATRSGDQTAFFVTETLLQYRGEYFRHRIILTSHLQGSGINEISDITQAAEYCHNN